MPNVTFEMSPVSFLNLMTFQLISICHKRALFGCKLQLVTILDVADQGSSGRPRCPGSSKLSFPSLKLSRTSLFSSTAFVVGEQTSDIRSRSLRTETRNLETRTSTSCGGLMQNANGQAHQHKMIKRWFSG